MTDWQPFRGTGQPHDGIDELPPPPDWRRFDGEPMADRVLPPWTSADQDRARKYQVHRDIIDLVNVGIALRRPLLVTGRPGVGKSTLAPAIAYELQLGPVLRWPITSRSTLKDGLYTYDAIGRLHDVNLDDRDARADIGRYLTLGPLGTALLPYRRPRVLLVDEIDKSDIDLPNDLLNVLEEGRYDIPELGRMAEDQPTVGVSTVDGTGRVPVERGQVHCHAFPIIVLTSNQEREFPPAFLRRCIPLTIPAPDEEQLARIVQARLGVELSARGADLVAHFLDHQADGDLATDQLLNAIYLRLHDTRADGQDAEDLAARLLRHLGSTPA